MQRCNPTATNNIEMFQIAGTETVGGVKLQNYQHNKMVRGRIWSQIRVKYI